MQPSAINGIGIFAVHDISSGIQVLVNFSPKKAKIKDIPQPFLGYCILLNDSECLCPERFDRMEIGWYLNHSDKPNLIKKEDHLFTIRDIQAGEEILLDYNNFNEPEHLKASYIKNPL